jgi:transcriptional regulator with XRE-family HTH domain
MTAKSARGDKRLAQAVKLARVTRNYSLNALAEDAKVSHASLYEFEHGRQGITVHTLRKIAKVLGLTFKIGG